MKTIWKTFEETIM